MDHLKQADELVGSALKLGAGEAEVYISRSSSTSIEVLDGKIESVNLKEETGLGVRVLIGGRLGFSYSALSPELLPEETIKRAIASSVNSAVDPFNGLPSPSRTPHAGSDGLFDDEISKLTMDRKIKMALEMESAAYAADKRVRMTERSAFSDSFSEVFIVNSKGINLTFRENLCGGHIDVICRERDEAESGSHASFKRRLKDLDLKEVGLKAAEKGAELLGAKPIGSEVLDLVMSNEVAAHFLDSISGLFFSDAIQKGKSALAGKMGSKIASDGLTIIDDGTMEYGIGTSPFDCEGQITGRTVLLEGGLLKGFLYDHYTASKDKTSSTGNAVRGSYMGLPGVGATNIYIGAGETRPEDMISGTKKGLLVKHVMGMHTVNPISGDFSVGASGMLIENGKISRPVRGVTIAGNLLDLLKKITAVGTDLQFDINVGAPTLFIGGISVGGQ